MDADVLALVGEERVLEAARLAAERGLSPLASELFERACAWGEAATHALYAGDHTRALGLALRAGDAALAERAVCHLPSDPQSAEALAAGLERRGHHALAAQVLERAGRDAAAAHAWERAGDAARAAALYERLGDVRQAARVLDAALSRQPDAWATALALGALLCRFGKDEAAVRTLQRVPPSAPERPLALQCMLGPLDRLGLSGAGAAAIAELAALARPASPAESPPAALAQEGVHPAAAQPSWLFGRYEIRASVASSPSARVLDCIDVVGRQRVAVKLFAAFESSAWGDHVGAFRREVEALKGLAHPSIVPLMAFFESGPATVLAWMGGGSLEEMLARGRLAPARAVEIACAVLAALADAHRLGILHRDVKPANVLFDSSGAARLSDFGTAHLGDLCVTATAGPDGHVAYVSPEQREGRSPTVQSDLFSVGALMHEMLTGERPDPDETRRIRPSDSNPDLDARHDAVVAGLMARSPRARPDGAIEARASLLAVPWPATAPAALPPLPVDKSPDPIARRIDTDPTGRLVDTWTGRAVERAPLSNEALARARAFAAADHRSLQTVLRVDRAGGVIWLAATKPRPGRGLLTEGECAQLSDALGALHAAGIAHGHVDAEHVAYGEDGCSVLRFAVDGAAGATPERDREALAQMAGRRPVQR